MSMRYLVSLLLCSTLLACGKTGALYLPEDEPAPTPAPAPAPPAEPTGDTETEEEAEASETTN